MTTCLRDRCSKNTAVIGQRTFDLAIQAVCGWIEFLAVASFEVRVVERSLTTIVTAGNCLRYHVLSRWVERLALKNLLLHTDPMRHVLREMEGGWQGWTGLEVRWGQ